MTTPLTTGSVVVTAPTGTKVLTSPGRMGPPGPGLQLDGAVPTYADLPDDLGPTDAGAAYVVNSNGLLYVWDGTAWPLEANGSQFKGEQGDQGRGVDDVTVVGADVLRFHMSDASIEDVTIPTISAAAASASAAAASASAAGTSATNAAASASTAATAATAAGVSEDNAVAAATAADESATAADVDAAAALDYRNQAQSAQASATLSATSAGSSADSATASASAASTSASNAAASAVTAGEAETDAVAAAGVAQGHAVDAAQSAAEAAASADEAATIVSGGMPLADNDTAGGIMLPGGVDGQLGGTYLNPVVTGWANKADLVAGKIPSSQIPATVSHERYLVADTAARLALTSSQVQIGDVAVQTGNPGRGTYHLISADPSLEASWSLDVSPTDAVTSVNGYNGLVVLSKADLGLANVDNTSDANKPVSTATQTALDGKAATSHTHDASAINAGTLSVSRLPVGTTAAHVAAGNDARFTDSRTPTAGSVTDASVAAGAAIALSKLATGRVAGSNNGTATNLTIWVGTEAQYTAIGTKDPNTLYFRTA